MPAIRVYSGRRAGQDLRALLQVREQPIRGADLVDEVGLLRQRQHAADLQLRVLDRRVEADHGATGRADAEVGGDRAPCTLEQPGHATGLAAELPYVARQPAHARARTVVDRVLDPDVIDRRAQHQRRSSGRALLCSISSSRAALS
jgi:hypothetical protein